MSGILSALWSIGSTYRPNAARSPERETKPLKFGAFQACYKPPRWGIQRPRTDAEAQQMYNHIRTVAFWLDASPLLADLGLPFRAGLDDIISLVPIYGDIVSGILQLYQVYLSFIFGVPAQILMYMILNVLADVFVGLIPLLGDFLDNLFKSNLRNLALVENWLLESHPTSSAARYHILLMPVSDEFLPRPKAAGWFAGGKKVDEVVEEERRTGRVRKTRRMGKHEGQVPVPNATPGDPLD
ncbi:hypothetical protein BCR39DRAFT_571208 [Naematelia encephala]|uniref:Uncharacterized protein n=1 Tax=Naematelia encephala TaxID=71784 RepID=A0A1Y2BB13_9TREE|nr:hypothetical protein BCR39DRAFT_571208 [Naematelia encephala]